MQKKDTTKQENEAPATLSTASVASRFYRLITDDGQPEEARRDLLEWFDQMCNHAGISLEHPAFFRRAFLMAALATEETPRSRSRKSLNAHFSWQAYDAIQKTLARTKAVESRCDAVV
jgi:hypothetical protein